MNEKLPGTLISAGQPRNVHEHNYGGKAAIAEVVSDNISAAMRLRPGSVVLIPGRVRLHDTSLARSATAFTLGIIDVSDRPCNLGNFKIS
jgi:hypothetical protein